MYDEILNNVSNDLELFRYKLLLACIDHKIDGIQFFLQNIEAQWKDNAFYMAHLLFEIFTLATGHKLKLNHPELYTILQNFYHKSYTYGLMTYTDKALDFFKQNTNEQLAFQTISHN